MNKLIGPIVSGLLILALIFPACTPEEEVEYGSGTLSPEMRASIDSLSSLINSDPNNKELYFQRGKIRFDAGLYQPAELDFLKSIQLGESPQYNIDPADYPDFIGPDYEFLGHTRYELGKAQGAYDAFTACIRVGYQVPTMYVHRSRVRSTERRFRDALLDADTAISLDSTSSFAYGAKAFYLDNINEPTAALENYGKAISLDPNDARLYSNRGYCYLRMGNEEMAAKDLEQSLKIEPDFPGALIYRGMLLMGQEKWQAAFDDFDMVLKKDESDPRIFYYRGLCLVKLKKLDEGCTDLKKAADAGDMLAPGLYQEECL